MNRAELWPAARADLVDIWESGVPRWGEDAADACIRELNLDLAKAAKTPLQGSARDWVVPGLRKSTVRSHHAYYLVIAKGIDVIRVLHPSMDMDSAFP